MTLTASLALVAFATGCGQAPVENADALGSNPSDAADPIDVPEEKLTSLWGMVWDYTQQSVEQIADDPDVRMAVSGTVVGFAQGPILFAKSAEDYQAAPQVVLAVQVDDVLKGERPASGQVYVQLEGGDPLEQYNSALPKGSTVVLYLSDAPQTGADWQVGDPSAGRPEGEPLWSVGPERFIVVDGDEGLVYPYLGKVKSEADFESVVP
jgi:hypothetical protein